MHPTFISGEVGHTSVRSLTRPFNTLVEDMKSNSLALDQITQGSQDTPSLDPRFRYSVVANFLWRHGRPADVV